MAALDPFMSVPLPNFAMEEELAPGRVRPVPAVTSVEPVRAVESREQMREEDRRAVLDAYEASALAKSLAFQASGQQAVAEKELRDPASVARANRNNVAIRDLVASFAEYDNSVAQAQFDRYLQLFVSLAADSEAAKRERRAREEVRARENALYASLGFLPGNISGEGSVLSLRMALAIDEWLRGRGVFLPSMLGYASSDGFRFMPFSGRSKGALRFGEVLGSYERMYISQYLREMARLGPENFLFYDQTGLGDLGLVERRRFLAEMRRILDEAGITAREWELRYVFGENEKLALDRLGLRAAELRRLEAYREAINTYYGMLRGLVRHYGAGIMSGSMGGASV